MMGRFSSPSQHDGVFFRYDVIVLTSDHKCCYLLTLVLDCTDCVVKYIQVWFTKANGKQNDITKLVL